MKWSKCAIQCDGVAEEAVSAVVAVRTAVVQDGAVLNLHHELLQHLHSHPNVHGQVSGRCVPGKSFSVTPHQSFRSGALSFLRVAR